MISGEITNPKDVSRPENVMFDASEFVRQTQRDLLGVSAVITRGDAVGHPIIVILGRVDAIVAVDRSVRLEAKAQDILIAAEDYQPTGVASEPMANDRITVTIDQQEVDYEVRPPSNGQKCFEFSNPKGSELRVHTKRVNRS